MGTHNLLQVLDPATDTADPAEEAFGVGDQGETGAVVERKACTGPPMLWPML
jgi:hypothetical protein